MPDISNLKGEKIYSGSCFQRFQFIVLGSNDSGTIVRKNIIMVVGACEGGHCSPHGIQEIEARKGPSIRYNLLKSHPSNLFPPTRFHLLKFPAPPKTVSPLRDQVFNT
jgi:hypothetical protein